MEIQRRALLNSLSRKTPLLLITVGLLLAIYVGTSYAWTAWQQHQLARNWEQLAGGQIATPDVNTNGAVMRIKVPKIELDAIVVEGTTRRQLLLGPGHLRASALPGATGNSVIAAHRDTFFRRLSELARGDSIEVEAGQKQFRYTVSETRIVEPADTSVLKSSRGPRLTLITCYPFHYVGPAPQRFVVIAELGPP